jgi:hypothetical protein
MKSCLRVGGLRKFPENSRAKKFPGKFHLPSEKFHHPVDFPESSRVALSGLGKPLKFQHPSGFSGKFQGGLIGSG